MVSPLISYSVVGQVEKNPAQVLINTGSALTLVHKDFGNHLPKATQQLQPVHQRLVGVNGTPLAMCSTALLEVKTARGPEFFSPGDCHR